MQISASPFKAALAYSTAKCTLQGLPSGGRKAQALLAMSQKFFLLSVLLSSISGPTGQDLSKSIRTKFCK